MRAVIQRVSQASVKVNDQIVGKIGQGLVILLGVSQDDSEADADYLAGKIAHLRIFEDSEGKMNKAITEVSGEVLAVSQFTLYANTRKGRRPSFIEAALPDKANPLYQYFIKKMKAEGVTVSEGIFGAIMSVVIYNQGPVTIILDSQDRHIPRK